MSISHNQKLRRVTRIRSRLLANPGIKRLSVYRSNLHIYAQIIDDKHGLTIVSASTKEIKDFKGTKSEASKAVGKLLASKALEKKVTHVKFDRGQYRYHGRVKALSEGAREGGLLF